MPDSLLKKDSLVSIGEAAKILGVSIDTIRRWDKAGKLTSQRVGKNRYFSVESLERVKFDQPLPISQASKQLQISATTLRRLEKKGLITPERNSAGERVYSRQSLEKFLNGEYFLRQKEVEEKILEPLQTGEVKENEGKVSHKVLAMVQEEVKEKVDRINHFVKAIYTSGFLIITAFVFGTVAVTISFLMMPQQTAHFFGYQGNTRGPQVLGAKYEPHQKIQGSAVGQILKPLTQIPLGIVKQVDIATYREIVPEKVIDDVNEIATIDEQGNLAPTVTLRLPGSSYLQIPDSGLISNLNAEFLQGKTWGTGEGNLAVFGSSGTIDGLVDQVGISEIKSDSSRLKISTDDNISTLSLDLSSITATLSNDSVLTEHIKNAAVTNSKLANSSITFAGNSGSGAISLGGTLTVSGAGINSASLSGGTITITGTEADTLSSVTGRGASTTNGITVGFLTSTGAISGSNFSGSSSGTNTGDQTSVSGNAGTATALQNPRTINGVSFDGTANITVTAAAGTLTGTTLASGVTASSLTSVGDLSALTVTGDVTFNDNSADTILIGQSGTTDDTVTIAGNISLTDDQWSIDGTGVTSGLSGTNTGLTVGDLSCTNCIGATEISDLTLGTDTAGDFVATIAAGNGISTTGASSGENIAHSISVDQSYAFAWTGQQSFTKTITAVGSLVDVNVTLGNDDDGDTVNGISIDVTSAATGDADNLYALNIGNTTNEASVVESAIRIGANWENAFDLNGTLLTSAELALVDSGVTFAELSSTPTTLSGYGITDALSNSATSTQDGHFGDVYLKDDSTPSHYLQITAGSNLTAAHLLTLLTGDNDRIITLNGDTTLSGTNTGDQTITLTGDVTGSGTGSFAATLGANTVGDSELDDTISYTGALTLSDLTISDISVPLTGSSLTFDFNNASDRTLTITNSNSGTANLTVEGTISQGGATLAATYAPISANFVTVTSNATLTGETGIDALTTAISTTSTLNVDSTTTLNVVTIDANAGLTLSSGTGQFSQTYAQSGSSGGNAQVLGFQNTNTANAGTTVGGLDITPTNTSAPLSGTNTLNLITFEAGGALDGSHTTNGIKFVSATGYSNFLTSPSIVISSAGAITGATGITSATGNVAITAGALILNGATRIANDGTGTFISGTVLGSQTFTTNNIVDSGALTIKTTTSSALTLDSGTVGDVNLGTGNNAKIIAVGTGTAGNTINIGTNNTTLDTISIGSGLDNVAITGDDWSVTNAGAAAFASVSEGGTALVSKYAPISADFITVAANGTLTGETAIGALSSAISTTSTLNVDSTATIGGLTVDSNASLTISNGLFSVTKTSAAAGDIATINGTSANAIVGLTVALTSTADSAADAYKGIDITWAESADADTITALNIGNTTTTNSATTAISIGTGWDTGISVASGGVTISAGALAVNSDSITSDGTLTIDSSGVVQLASGDDFTTDDLTVSGADITGANGEIFDIGTADSTYVLELNSDATATLTVSDSVNANTPLTINSAGTGTLTLDAAGAGNVDLGTGANARTITLGNTTTSSTVNINSGTGGINLQAAGTTTIDTIQIGAGGAGNSTPDYFALDVKSDTGDPAGGFEGAMYYNTFDNVFRCYQNTGWTNCIGAGGSTSLQSAYNTATIGLVETNDTDPILFTETGATNPHSIDILQVTANPATGGIFSGDALQITQTAVDASGFTGNGLHMLVDRTKNTGNVILAESTDGGNITLLKLDENGALTLRGGQTIDITSGTAATGLTIKPADAAAANGIGGALALTGSDSTSGTCGTDCIGGGITITAGAATGGAGTRHGGSVTINAGDGAASTAVDGTVTIGSANTSAIALGNTTNNTTLTLTGSGLTTLGGSLTVTGGTIIGANSEAIAIGDANDVISLTIGGATEYTFNGTTFDVGSNTITNVGTNITAAAALTITSTGSNNDITLTSADDILSTLVAGGQIALTATTANTTTDGIIKLDAASTTLNNIGLNILYSSNNGVTTGDDLFGAKITLTQADADGDLFGLQIINANSTLAGSSTDDLLTLHNADTSNADGGTVDNGLKISAAGGAITTGINLNDTDIATAIKLQQGESIDNSSDNQINLNIGTSGTLLLTSGTAATIANSAGILTVDSAGGAVAISGTDTLTVGGALAANGGITFDAGTDTVGAFTMAGNIIGGSFIITDLGSTGTDFTTSGALAVTLDATEAEGALSVDNGANASSIFVAEDNGTDVFTIADGGIVTATQNINADGGLDVDDAFVVADGGAVSTLSISDINVPLTGASFTFDFNNVSDRTLTIANSGDGTANLTVEGTISQGGATLAATYAPISANFVTVTSNATLTGETGIDALTTAISTTNSLNVDGASTLAGTTLDANANLTLTSGTGSLIITNAVTNASDKVIDITPSFTGGAADPLVYTVIDLAGFTADNGVGTDTVNGLSVGALTETGAGAITSSAIKIGKSWDNSLLFTTDATHTLRVEDQDSATVGGSTLQIIGAAGNTTGAGGLISITAGAAGSGANATGGGLTFTTGAGGGSGTANSGALTLLSGNAASGTAGTISIDVGTSSTGQGAVSIATAGRAQTVNMGNTTGATLVNIDSGTGGVTIDSTSTGDIVLNSTDTLLLDSATVLELNSSGGIISIGNDNVNQNINIGTAGVRTIALGSSSAAAITFTTDNNAATDFSFTGGTTFNNGVTITGTLDSNGDVTIADTSVVFDGASTLFTVTGTLGINTGGNITVGDGGDGVTLSSGAADITFSSTDDVLANPGDDFLTTLAAAGQFIVDGAATDSTIAGATEGIAKLVVDAGSVTSADIQNGFYIDFQTIDDATANQVHRAVRVDFTNSSGDGGDTSYALSLNNVNDAGASVATDALIALENNDANTAVGTGIVFLVGGANAPDFTTGIDMSTATFTTDITFQNGESLTNSVTDTIVLASNATNGAGVVRVPVKTTTGDPSLNVEGNIYYNDTDNVFRCYQNTGWTNCIGAGGSTSLQTAYNTATIGLIETDTTNPILFTETTGENHTVDILQITSNTPTGFTNTGDVLQLTMDSGAANGLSGHGIHEIIDQSQVTGNAILVEDDQGTPVELFKLDKDGGLTLGTVAGTTAVTITDTDYTNALSIADNVILGTTAAITFTDFTVDADGNITQAPDALSDAQIITLPAAASRAIVVNATADNTLNSATQGVINYTIDAAPPSAGTAQGIYLDYEHIDDLNANQTVRAMRIDFLNSSNDAADATTILSLNNVASGASITDSLFSLENNDASNAVAAGMVFAAGGAGTDFTYGIDFSLATFGTAELRFKNSGTLSETAAGTWTFDKSAAGTVVLVATDDDTNSALTIQSSGTGALTLNPTGTGQVVITTTNTSASALDINANGVVAGNAITIDSSDGGIAITAGGASNGDITILATDDMSINGTAGSILSLATSNVTQTLNIGLATSVDISITDPNWSITGSGVANLAANSVIGTQTHASNAITDSGALTITSTTNDLTLNSGSGHVMIAANDGLTFAATTASNNGAISLTINAGASGTTAKLLVKLDTSGTVITTDTSTLNNAVGVALDTKTSGQAVRVAVHGVVTVTADNTVTAGDYIGVGTTTAGRLKSLGTTYPSTANLQVVGRALSGASAGSDFLLMLDGLDNNVSAGAACATCVSFATGVADNTTGSNDLLKLTKSGVERLTLTNGGGLRINGQTNNVVRTTTGDGTGYTDFGRSGSTIPSTIINSGDRLELDDGTPGNTGSCTACGVITTNSSSTTANVGAGGHAISRPDGKYIVILGGGSTSSNIYDSVANTFTSTGAITLSAAAGAGSTSLPRPDGKYLVIHGGGVSSSSIVDPTGTSTTAAAGVSTNSIVMGTGTVSFRRANGRFLLTGQNISTTALYNPVAGTWAAGPTLTAATSTGALSLPRPDGQALIIHGGNTSTTTLYNPTNGAADIGSTSAGPTTQAAGCVVGNGTGTAAIRRPDGKYVVLTGAQSATALYDPVANTFVCRTTNGPEAALGDGAHAISIQNGKYLVVIGGASQVADVYDPSTDTFAAFSTTAVTAGGAGRHSLMRYDGKWQMIAGGGAKSDQYNTNLAMSGTYISDPVSTTALNSSSVLRWTAQLENIFTGTNAATNTAFSNMQFFVKTATDGGSGCTTPLGSATFRELNQSGDLIRPTAAADNCAQVQVIFNRPIPKRLTDERGTWEGNNHVALRRDYATPTLLDFSIDNSTVLRRNNFEFTLPNAGSASPQTETSGPTGTTIGTTQVEAQADRVYLPFGRIAPLAQVGSTGFYQGLIGNNHPNMLQAASDGTLVIKKPNNTFLVIAGGGNSTTNVMQYDPATTTFAANATSIGALTGLGAHVFKRPDGKFLIVRGGATSSTHIYDPVANTFSAGPNIPTGTVGVGASSILNKDGTYTIVQGGAASNTSVYDPVRNTIFAGPFTSTVVNCGSWAIPLVGENDGSYRVFAGIAASTVAGTSATMIYDSRAKVFTAGTSGGGTYGCGSFAFQRPDGYWVGVSAQNGVGVNASTTNIINPWSNTAAAGAVATAQIGHGAHVIPRSDGTFMVLTGNASSTTSVYIPFGSTQAEGAPIGSFGGAGPTTVGVVGVAATSTANLQAPLSFQRPDGKFVVILGANTSTTNIYDAGWYPNGQYLSEQIQVPAMTANSTLEWKQSTDQFVRFEVRTSTSQALLSTAAYKSVGRSGDSIGNGASDTWVQVEANFRRNFPTFGGAMQDVWVGAGAGAVYDNYFSKVAKPTVFEYKINNGQDLLNLQDNGLSQFRVTSAGNVYSGPNGQFLAGGADLAENYTSKESLEPGEVVRVDPVNSQGVLRSVGQGQQTLLGVVSTAPGFVAGGYTKDAYPIALVGRVPVKVSSENGPIKIGDYLTSSSIPGYAMRANQAGRVIGKALENFDPSKAKECPLEGMGNVKTTKCGQVMMFVNLTDYNGSPVELVMAEKKASEQLAGLETTTLEATSSGMESQLSEVATPSMLDKLPDNEAKILKFLSELKNSRTDGVKSEVFTDRVAAVYEIISPKIITDILYAKRIKADSIEGFEILTDKISNLSEKVSGLSNSNSTPSAILSNLNTQISTSSASVSPATTSGELIADTLHISKDSFFAGLVQVLESITTKNFIVTGWARFLSEVIFKGEVIFEGRPTFNADTAGFAVITKGADKVEVKFDKEYAQTPLINISITLDEIVTEQDKALLKPEELEAKIKAGQQREETILNGDFKYIVTERSTKGFLIKLNKPSIDDLKFSWSALAIKDAKTLVSQSVLGAQAVSVLVPSPAPIVPSTPISTPSATPTKEIIVKETELGYLRVRKEPSTASEEIGQVTPGAKFTVLEQQAGENDWYKIEFSSGQTGWVSSSYVTISQ